MVRKNYIKKFVPQGGGKLWMRKLCDKNKIWSPIGFFCCWGKFNCREFVKKHFSFENYEGWEYWRKIREGVLSEKEWWFVVEQKIFVNVEESLLEIRNYSELKNYCRGNARWRREKCAAFQQKLVEERFPIRFFIEEKNCWSFIEVERKEWLINLIC